MAYIDLDEINRLHPKLTAKYPLSFANGISAAINEINRLPNADVVPKTEVEALQAEVERLQKHNTEFARKHYEDGYNTAKTEVEILQCALKAEERHNELTMEMAQKALKNAKADVAREIFEEIDGITDLFAKGLIGELEMYDKLAELKKKYTEGET